MDRTARTFIDELGGYRHVAKRLGVAHTTLHSHITAQLLPPRWYVALSDFARECGIMPPSYDLFDFKALPALAKKESAA